MAENFNGQTELDEEVRTSHGENLQGEKGTGESKHKVYAFWNAFPAIAFVVFACVTVILMALVPVAKENALGLKESFGSIFSALRFDEIAGLNALSIGVLIFGVLTIIYAVILLQHKFSTFKYRKAFGKPLYKVFECISLVFALVHVIFAVLLIEKIVTADEGLKILRVGAYPVLTLILSVVYLVVAGVAIILCGAYEKAHPEILSAWQKERQTAKAEAKTGAAKAKKAARYVGKKVSKKAVMLIVPLAAVLLVTAFTNATDLVARFEAKPFDANDLKEIILKDGANEISRVAVEAAIGKPYVADGGTAEDLKDVYYTETYRNLLKRAERNKAYALLAIEQGDWRVSGLLKQARNLEWESEVLAYGEMQITYSEQGYVLEAMYDNVVIDGMPAVSKKLDHVEILRVAERNESDSVRRVESVRYVATYMDGSFTYGTCKNVAVVLEDGTVSTTYEGSYVGKTLQWQDAFGEYQVVATANSSET